MLCITNSFLEFSYALLDSICVVEVLAPFESAFNESCTWFY